MTAPIRDTARHLVLDSKADATAGQALIAVACKGDEFVPYDRAQHTYLTRLSTCPECRVVHAAWVELFKADLNRDTHTEEDQP